MNNILVTGANGQLGSEIKALKCQYPEYRFIFTTYKELDITDFKKVEDFVESQNIDALINCAAYTRVDKAEKEWEKADLINHLAVENLAGIAKRNKIKLIHISTDYVFDGNSKRPYLETNVPNPQNVYGKTKLAGEEAILRINPANSIIIRTSWVYSANGENFVKTMLRLGREKDKIKVVSDQLGVPTYAGDLASAILEILPQIENKMVEIYHYTNEGMCTWYEFAKAIFSMKDLAIEVCPASSKEFPTVAKRPVYSVLDKSKIRTNFNLEIPNWKDSLAECLKNN